MRRRTKKRNVLFDHWLVSSFDHWLFSSFDRRRLADLVVGRPRGERLHGLHGGLMPGLLHESMIINLYYCTACSHFCVHYLFVLLA